MKKILEFLEISKKDMILFFIVLFIMACASCTPAVAQDIKREGKTFIVTNKSSGTIETNYIYKDNSGQYIIYITKNKKCYINKVSKKSGKTYKKYLPDEIATQILKELNMQ